MQIRNPPSGLLRALLLACALSVACAARAPISPVTAAAPTPGGHWPYFRMITLDTTPAGANVTEDVTGYPLAVILDRNGIDFGQARPDGHDVRFFDSAGKPLPHAIETWDAEARKAAVRVLVDRIKAGSADQAIVMRWGNPEAPDISNAPALDEARVKQAAPGPGWAKLDHESRREGQTLLKFSEIRLN
jgi:hypothetical protein